MAKKSAFNIVTANHLLEGDSIFLSDDGWTRDHRAALVARSPEEAAELEARGQIDEAANQVVGVYLVAVEIEEDGRPEPIHFREKMRVLARPSFWAAPAAAHAPGRTPAYEQANAA
ncbi:MAG: DUF2849 domain-containing protein [Rhodomicrobiaceae bacterium]